MSKIFSIISLILGIFLIFTAFVSIDDILDGKAAAIRIGVIGLALVFPSLMVLFNKTALLVKKDVLKPQSRSIASKIWYVFLGLFFLIIIFLPVPGYLISLDSFYRTQPFALKLAVLFFLTFIMVLIVNYFFVKKGRRLVGKTIVYAFLPLIYFLSVFFIGTDWENLYLRPLFLIILPIYFVLFYRLIKEINLFKEEKIIPEYVSTTPLYLRILLRISGFLSIGVITGIVNYIDFNLAYKLAGSLIVLSILLIYLSLEKFENHKLTLFLEGVYWSAIFAIIAIIFNIFAYNNVPVKIAGTREGFRVGFDEGKSDS